MADSQHYQYSMDGSTWTNFAGPYAITRTLAGNPGHETFTTAKSGVHSVTEPYKP